VTALLELIHDPSTWADALVRQAFVEPVADRVLRLHANRELWLTALERCPRTLCHHDAHRGNLFAWRTRSGLDQTVAIDWAQVGTGAVGEDLVQLVMSLFADGMRSGLDAPTVHEDMFASYLEGLCQAGWQGDSRLCICAR
jgi:Ser/Thr protein kinase RdoA (MazF antagonist)